MTRQRRDLPGYSSDQQTEAVGLHVVQRQLTEAGFKVTEVSGRFDDGIDLIAAPHDPHNVLPAWVGVQVRAGRSYRRRLGVGQHATYWRMHNIPVFGVVVTDPDTDITWCNATAHLRRDPNARSIAADRPFPGDIADEIHAVLKAQRATSSVLDVFDDNPLVCTRALVSLLTIADDPRVARVLRARGVPPGPHAARYALGGLVLAERHGVDTAVTANEVAALVAELYAPSAFGASVHNEFQPGTQLALDLLALRSMPPEAVYQAGARHSGEVAVAMVHMAVGLVDHGRQQDFLELLLRGQPRLWESPDVQQLWQCVAEGGYDFAW